MKIKMDSSAHRFKGNIVLFLLYFCFLVVFMIDVFPFLGNQQELLDFGSFYASGLQMQRGENPYDPNSEYVLKINFAQVGAGGNMVNLNPPVTAMLFEILAQSDPHQSLKTWQIASAVLFTSLIFVLTAEYRQNTTPTVFIWAFSLAGFWQTLTLGQIYIFLLLFVILAWILLQRKQYVAAGIAMGIIVAVKPNFIVWPFFLWVAGYASTFFAALCTGLVISLIPIPFYGIAVYQQWLDASTLQRGTLVLPGNSSLIGLAARLNHIPIGVAVSLVLIVVLLYALKKSSSKGILDTEDVSGLGIIAAILASPISWVGYTLFLLPFFFSRKKWTALLLLSAANLSFPFAFVLKLWQDSPLNFVIFGWFYGWGLLLLLRAVVRKTMMTSSIQTN